MRSRSQFPSIHCKYSYKFLTASALAIGFAAQNASAAFQIYEGPGTDLGSAVWTNGFVAPDTNPIAFGTNGTALFENAATYTNASPNPTIGITLTMRYLAFDTGASSYTIGGAGTLSLGNGISASSTDVALQADFATGEEIDANVLINGTGGSNATKDDRRMIRLTNGSSLTITSPVIIAQAYMVENPDATSTLRLTNGFSNTKAGSVYDTGAGTVILGSTDLGWTGNYYVGELKAGAGTPGQNLTTGNGTTRVTSDTSFGGAPFAELLSTDGKIELANGNAGGLNTLLDVRGRADATVPQLTSLTGTSDVFSNTFQNESGGTGSNYILEAQASSTLTFSPTSKVSNGSGVASTLNLVGAGTGVMNGSITEDTASWSVVKSGSGTWTIGGAQTYTGTTSVAGGELLVTGTHTGGGNYAVQSGATLAIGSAGSIGIGTATSQTFDVATGGTFDLTAVSGGYALASGQTLIGNGAVLGGLKLATGSTISPGEAGVGSLAIGSLTTTGGGTLQYDLPNASTGTNDKIVVNGNLTLSGTTTVAYIGATTSGSYHLIDYTGTLSGNSANFTLLSQNPGTTGTSRPTTYAVNTSVLHQVTLDVTGGAGNLTWVGGQNSNAWNLINTVNFTGAPGASPDNRFYTADFVTFDNTGSTSPAVNVQGTLSPAKVTFNNGAGHDYTLGGSGDIIDSGDLIASNAGNVTLNQSGFTVTGSLNFSGSGNLNIANSSAALFNGSFITSGSGNLNISSVGGATLNGGLTLGGSGNVTVTTTDFAVVNTFTDNSTGTVTIANTGTLILPAAVALNSGTLALSRSDSYSINSSISGAGTLRKDGTGTMTLTANNSSFSGPIVVANGTLRMNKGLTTALGGASSTTTVNSGGALDLNGTKFTTRVVTLAGSGPAGAPIQGALIDGSNSGVTSSSFSQVNGAILAADTTFGVSNSFLEVTGSLQGNSHNLTLIGAGAPLTNECDITDVGETHLANITVDGGALFFNESATLGDQPGVVTCQNGGNLGFEALSAPITKNIVMSSSGGGGVTCFNSDNTIASQIQMNGDTELDVFSLGSGPAVSNRTLTVTGKITGPGNLSIHDDPRVKSGFNSALDPGTVVLTSNDNNYTGATNIGGGGGYPNILFANDHAILSVGNGGTTGMIPVGSDINNNGVLLFNRNDTFTVPNHIGGIGTVVFAGSHGSVTLSGPNDYAGKTIVQAGTVELTSNAQAPIFQGTGTDIQNGRMVFDYGSGSTLPTDIRGDLIASYNDAAFTNTAGEFFASSTAVVGTRGLGEYDDGVSKVSVAAVYYGDANLDGVVNALDFNALATNYGSSAGIWQKGDFNYDGSVNSADFDALAANFGQALPTSAEPVGAEMALGALVPEPTSLGLLGLAACGVLSRRRRAAIMR